MTEHVLVYFMGHLFEWLRVSCFTKSERKKNPVLHVFISGSNSDWAQINVCVLLSFMYTGWKRVDMWSEIISSLYIWFSLQMTSTSCKLVPSFFHLKWTWKNLSLHARRKRSQYIWSFLLIIITPVRSTKGSCADLFFSDWGEEGVLLLPWHRHVGEPPGNRKCLDFFNSER